MSVLVRRTIPMAIAFICAIFVISDLYLTITPIKMVSLELQFDATMLAAFLISVGCVGLIIKNIRDISKRKPGLWYFSIWLIFLFSVFMVVGLRYTQSSELYQWIYSTFDDPIIATDYGLCGFFIIICVYRTFRLRSVEGSLLIITATITLLYSAPIGVMIFPPSNPIGDYITNTVAVGANRAFTLVSSIGALMFSIRALLGSEKTIVQEVD